MDNFTAILSKVNISEYAIINFDKLTVINNRLLEKSKEYKSALIMLIPYKTYDLTIADEYNIGLFARCKDYHRYADALFSELLPQFEDIFGGDITGFADHSPINEKQAAALSGLGFIGKNGLLINPKYGSFVFICELLFTQQLPEKTHIITKSCGNCNECIKACPTGAIGHGLLDRSNCLSFVSQKKSKTSTDAALLKKHKTIWGCDICQNVCHYNKNAVKSELLYFKNDFLYNFTQDNIKTLSDDEYSRYAFSFRPRSVIEQNFLTVNTECDIIDT